MKTIYLIRPLQNTPFVIAVNRSPEQCDGELKQSRKADNIKEIAASILSSQRQKIMLCKGLIILTFVIAFVLSPLPIACAEGDWEKWEQFAQSKDSQIIKSWLSCRLKEQFKQAECAPNPKVATPSFYGRYGVFVTLLHKGKVRGCFGSFSPSRNNFTDVLDDYLQGALRRDPRYKPLDITEVPNIQIIVTIAGAEHQVEDLDAVDTESFGVTVTFASNEKMVYVPSELRNIGFLKNKLAGKDVYQVSVFRALTIK